MKSVSIFFLLSSVVINVVIGAPLLLRKELIPVTDDLNQRSDVYHGTTDLELYSAARDVHSEWDDIDGYFRRSATFSVDGNSHDPNEYRDLAVRPRGDMVLHGRDGNAAKVQKAGDAISKTGDVLSKAAKAADAIPEVGEIVGTALQVVSYFMKILGGLLKGIAEAERESAALSSGAFTQDVVKKTLEKHPGWFVVIVKPDHYFYGQGDEKTDWAHDKTQITTKTGTYHYDVYAARAGVFMNNGDGGFINWAFLPGNLPRLGWQGHRLAFANGAPKNKPKAGKCSMHLYHYHKNSDKNPFNQVTVVAILKDQNGIVIGFNGDGNADKGFNVASQLPHPVHIINGKKKDSLEFTYGKDKWDNNAKGRCNNGKFDNGISQKDCFFTCTF